MLTSSQQSPSYQEDYLSITDLIVYFWSRKNLIASIVLLCVLGASTYVFFVPPIYVSIIDVSPINQKQISNINSTLIAAQLQPIDINALSTITKDIIQSNEFKKIFFYSVYLPLARKNETQGTYKSESLLYGEFLKKIILKENALFNNYNVMFHSNNPDESLFLTQQYISFLKKEISLNFTKYLNTQKETLLKSIQFSIDEITRHEKNNLKMRLFNLENALKIAKKIDITKSMIKKPISSNDLELLPLLGVPLLTAEINILKEIQPQNIQILNLQSDYNNYKKVLSLSPEDIANIYPNIAIKEINQPILLNKKIIFSLTLIFGLLLGCYVSLLLIKKN